MMDDINSIVGGMNIMASFIGLYIIIKAEGKAETIIGGAILISNVISATLNLLIV